MCNATKKKFDQLKKNFCFITILLKGKPASTKIAVFFTLFKGGLVVGIDGGSNYGKKNCNLNVHNDWGLKAFEQCSIIRNYRLGRLPL